MSSCDPAPSRGGENTRARGKGFTLIEVMVVVAIIGLLLSLAYPAYNDFLVRAKVAEGLNVLATEKTRIVEFHSSRGRLPQTFNEIGWPPATTTAFGGPAASFQHVFGYDSEIWRQVEYQVKSGGTVMALRSYQRPQWNNIEISLHLQIKPTSDGAVKFRCTVDADTPTEELRKRFVPSNCHAGQTDDWSW